MTLLFQEFFDRRPHSGTLRLARDLTFALISAAAFARMGYLLVVPLELVGDESYYWDWGRQLAWGYFSKPPLIAWLMALGDLMGGGTAMGIRALAVLFGAMSLFAVFFLAHRLYDERVGMLAVLTLLCTPANAASNLLLTIDAPLLACWTIALASAWRWLRPLNAAGQPLDLHAERRAFERPRVVTPERWAIVFLMLALTGGLLAKQMMIVFPLLTLIWLGLEPNRRGWLRKPGLYVVLFLPLLAWVPPLWWNAQNDWITFQHTATHFGGGSVSLGRQASRFFEFIGSQAGIFTPVSFGLLVFVLIGMTKRWRQVGERERFLLSYAVPGLIVVLLMALRQRINPNWPAVFYPSAFVLLAAWVMAQVQAWRGGRWVVPTFFGGLFVGLLLTVVTYAAPWWSRHLPADADPTTRLRGWQEVARQSAEAEDWVIMQNPSEKAFILVGGHRYYTSAIAFYHPLQPTVFRWETPGTVKSQYEVWGLPPADPSMDVLIVWPEDAGALPSALSQCFAQIEPVPLQSEPDHDDRYARPVSFFVGREWRGGAAVASLP